MNQVIEQHLCSFVHPRPTYWHKFLAFAEWSCNTLFHSNTRKTQYEATYGKPPPSIPHYIVGSSTNEVVDSLLATREVIHELLKCRLLTAHEKMKKHSDIKRKDEEFGIGHWVYVKLRPYRQISVTSVTHNNKLAKCFYNPSEIVERIGKVAYCLRLQLKDPPCVSLFDALPTP
ncbi:uncharacterized protein LOC114420687 [Glycine soja]|uniref:uncharacterized protein n=1 Tax=Glycine max TaxID=3847 RepID=UPI0003DED129|nr:uncharacterized protein LOC102660417 [Glycine max]XP_028242319.1 uncharacterized protein LOC114420687 [Glycine soja]|eukprot:XP_006584410.1 uncharacterized protein LOC102660417 [Glycine max]